MKNALALLMLLPLLVLAACSDVESTIDDVASSAGTQAGCEVAGRAVDEGRTIVDRVREEIGVDAGAVRTELAAVGTAIEAAAPTLSGQVRELVDQAASALSALRDEAASVADGTTVDDQAIEAAQSEYDAAADQLTSLC